jgi:hypothetical protein
LEALKKKEGLVDDIVQFGIYIFIGKFLFKSMPMRILIYMLSTIEESNLKNIKHKVIVDVMTFDLLVTVMHVLNEMLKLSHFWFYLYRTNP